MGLSLEKISSRDWAEFQKLSPQCSVFSSVEFLESLGPSITYFLVRKGSEKIAGFPVLHSNSEIEVPPFSVDAGIHYSAFTNLKENSRNELRHKINELFAAELFSRFEKISFNNHPTIIDLRAFDWYNYPAKHKAGGYQVQVRYTSYLQIKNENRHVEYSQLRRRDLKNAIALGAKFEPSNAISELNRLHSLTFARQGISRSELEIKTLVSIASKMLNNGRGRLYTCQIDGKYIAANFWLIGGNIAHYLFGANDPQYRSTGSGTLCIDLAIDNIYKNNKIKTFDFVGINSPQRGAFKSSFGGVVIPYFNITKQDIFEK